MKKKFLPKESESTRQEHSFDVYFYFGLKIDFFIRKTNLLRRHFLKLYSEFINKFDFTMKKSRFPCLYPQILILNWKNRKQNV